METREQHDEYLKAAQSLDWDAVYNDISALLKSNRPDIYPADDMLDGSTSYGPFFIRQAWHCAGSYRTSDGLGGCAGGRQRFDPELSWPDNTNLDKAKRLLYPIKEKYGLGLSWGDLIILTGKVAIEEGGFPGQIGFCAGRPDQVDGSQSILMGPTTEQKAIYPCTVNGECVYPFGATTIGLIYVNPGGVLGDYINLEKTAEAINQTFGLMAMNAEETVALIGGGHAFGKTHGACKIDESKFLPPDQNPSNPWPISICPNGTFTTGFEGYWTGSPKMWSNAYFKILAKDGGRFAPVQASGGQYQYTINGANSKFMMLPSDISLARDPVYASYVQAFAANTTYLSQVFGAAWYKLTTRDMGPISRCLNIKINGTYQLPPAQPFQYPLPPPRTPLPDFGQVRLSIHNILYTSASVVPPGFSADYVNGEGCLSLIVFFFFCLSLSFFFS